MHSTLRALSQTNLQTNPQKRINKVELIQNPALRTSVETGDCQEQSLCVYFWLF